MSHSGEQKKKTSLPWGKASQRTQQHLWPACACLSDNAGQDNFLKL